MTYRISPNDRKERGYTLIDNVYLNDSRLSLKTKGVFTYILSLSDDWELSKQRLADKLGVNECTLRTSFKELESAGYIVHSKARGSNGKYVCGCWDVYEVPKYVYNLEDC